MTGPPLRILMVNYEFPPFGGGTGVACRQLLESFAERHEPEIDLLTSGPAPHVERQRFSERITLHRLPVAKRDRQVWRAGELWRWTRAALRYAPELASGRHYDLCHCWAGWPSGIVGHRLRARMPYLVSLRGSDVPGYNRRLALLDPLLFRPLVRRVWRRASRVVALSDNLREMARRTDAGVPIGILPNGADVEHFRPAEHPGGDLLFVGRLIDRKGVAALIEAFADIARETPGLRLRIVGDGPLRAALEARARDCGIAGQVVFHGHLPAESLPEVYRLGGVLMVPSAMEALGNVVLEGMASGLAIVTTRTGAAELIDGNGIVIDDALPATIRDAIARYLHQPDLLRAHQLRSRSLAQGLSWHAVAGHYLDLYGEVLRGRVGAATAAVGGSALRAG